MGLIFHPRREFLTRIGMALGLVAIGEALWVLGSFLRPRIRGVSLEAVLTAGPVESFAPGSVTAFPVGKFYLVRLEDDGFLALHRECTHLGCTVPWSEDERKFVCPCHASVYDIHGDVLKSPAPRPLDWLPVRIENGIVKVVVGQRQRRSDFRPSQVSRI
jgi:cytochrome b6-f complex iron-sulfur subunit